MEGKGGKEGERREERRTGWKERWLRLAREREKAERKNDRMRGKEEEKGGNNVRSY